MKQIVTRPDGSHKVIVEKNYYFKDIIVPKGYVTNGASIPRLFWIVYPPFYPNYLTASVVHDYLCDKEEYAKADRYFQEILVKTGVGRATRTNLVTSVKLWHKIAYKNNKPRAWLRIIKKWRA